MSTTRARTQTFGVHTSIAGGLHNALVEVRRLGCDCIQIFVKNQRQWKAPPLQPAQIEQWHQTLCQIPLRPVVAHSTYLINLASGDAVIRPRSIRAFTDELRRCAALGVAGLVIHPGAHGGAGETAGICRVAEALRECLARTAGSSVKVLLEITAGQGSCLGHRFEHLRDIMAAVEPRDRLGVCLDTCHLHAAGYDLAGEDGYERMAADLERTIGFAAVACVHTNDSLKPAGSRVDRHAHIGQGTIGLKAFRRLLHDKRFAGIPKILETPKQTAPDGRDWDTVNLETLRRLAARSGSTKRARHSRRSRASTRR